MVGCVQLLRQLAHSQEAVDASSHKLTVLLDTLDEDGDAAIDADEFRVRTSVMTLNIPADPGYVRRWQGEMMWSWKRWRECCRGLGRSCSV